MRCYHPLDAFRDPGGGIVVGTGLKYAPLRLRCGQCIGCRIQRSESWAIRCVHEGRMHECSSVILLTYDDEHLPVHGDLRYSDFQLFVRRARRKLGPFRFFMCGEYGEAEWRPHFHAVMFGVYFSDRKYFKESASGTKVYTSAVLSELWPYGHCSVSDFSYEAAGYIARYVTKKVTGARAAEHYSRVDDSGGVYHLTPEFMRCSLKPGIGVRFFEKYRSEIFPRDEVVLNGRKLRPPRLYFEYLKDLDADEALLVEAKRQAMAWDLRSDSSKGRLGVQEVVTKARYALKSRTL